MGKVAVVTDSMACIPAELVEAYGIHIIPVYVVFGQKVFRDGVDLTPAQFYRMLRTTEVMPSTATFSVGECLELYTELSQDAEAIVAIFISKEFSATVETALEAKSLLTEGEERSPVPIRVIDSRTTAMAQGFVALAAARAAAEGRSLSEIIRKAEDVICRVSLMAVVDTFEYLRRSGRVPAIAAIMGSMLQIKPIISVEGGRAEVLDRPRTKAKAVRRMLEIMEERVGSNPVHVAVLHGDALEEAERLRGEVASRFDCVELLITELSPVLGAHAGPGVLGMAFWAES